VQTLTVGPRRGEHRESRISSLQYEECAHRLVRTRGIVMEVLQLVELF